MIDNKIVKYLISGACAAFIELVVFYILLIFSGAHLIVLIQILSFLAGFVTSFLLNRKWVFASRGDVKAQLPKYGFLALVNLILSAFMISGLTQQLEVPAILAKLVVMVSVVTWNFVIFNKLIFKQQT